MGVIITSNNASISFDCSYSGFYNLRKNIAILYDMEFGEHYGKLINCRTKEDYEKFDNKANEICKRLPDEDSDILDFFFQPDTEGKINYKTCGKLYEIIKDVDFGNRIFLYSAYSDGKDYEYFKDFLKECYSHRRNLIWY